jgi:hypothetical protein
MTVKELKEKLKDLPDDMPVLGYKGGNGDLWSILCWLSEDDDGKVFVISVD